MRARYAAAASAQLTGLRRRRRGDLRARRTTSRAFFFISVRFFSRFSFFLRAVSVGFSLLRVERRLVIPLAWLRVVFGGRERHATDCCSPLLNALPHHRNSCGFSGSSTRRPRCRSSVGTGVLRAKPGSRPEKAGKRRRSWSSTVAPTKGTTCVCVYYNITTRVRVLHLFLPRLACVLRRRLSLGLCQGRAITGRAMYRFRRTAERERMRWRKWGGKKENAQKIHFADVSHLLE